jgi:hypothetical protein
MRSTASVTAVHYDETLQKKILKSTFTARGEKPNSLAGLGKMFPDSPATASGGSPQGSRPDAATSPFSKIE